MPTHGAWWAQVTRLSPQEVPQRPDGAVTAWYRFGEGVLALDADNQVLHQRLQQIYSECAVLSQPQTVHVHCTIRTLADYGAVSVRCHDAEPLDALAFMQTLFPERDYVECPPVYPGWRLLGKTVTPERPLLTVCGEAMFVDHDQPWQALVANYVLNRVLRLQHERLFFHAASVGMHGAGVLLTGAKGAGKSTLSVALAARGHDFLGDEIAAVHHQSGEMLPFRRAVSLRPGVRAQRVDARLQVCHAPEELYPDGTTRVRVRMRDLFPDVQANPVPLRSAIFLRQFAPQPRLERFTPNMSHIRFLQPLGCTMWGVSPGQRVFDFLHVLSRARCYFLDVGLPEATAELIEHTVEDA